MFKYFEKRSYDVYRPNKLTQIVKDTFGHYSTFEIRMFKYFEKCSYDVYRPNKLTQIVKGNEVFLQRMALLQNLDIHRGCVNSVVWDDKGEYLLSGSDDQQLIISKPWNGKTVKKLRTSHRANIFSAKFIPFSSNNQIISCSGDGILTYTDLNHCDETYDCRYTCHVDTCYDVITIPSDPYSFLSCGEDGTVRWFDLRIKTSCLAHECKEDILLNMGRAVTAIAVNPLTQFQLAVATQDSTIHIYDRRMLGTKAHDSFLSESSKAILMHLRPQSLEGKKHRVTSLRYNSSGNQILASYSSDYLYLFDTKNFKDVPMEGVSAPEVNVDTDSEPTLKRLRLRGDWSDTGPQAVPKSEIPTQAEDVGQARPTLQSTLMQRMTDILSRMLHTTSQRRSRRGAAPADGSANVGVEMRGDGDVGEEAHLANISDLPSRQEEVEEEGGRETSSAPPSISSPSEGPLPYPRLLDSSVPAQPPSPSSVSGSLMSEDEEPPPLPALSTMVEERTAHSTLPGAAMISCPPEKTDFAPEGAEGPSSLPLWEDGPSGDPDIEQDLVQTRSLYSAQDIGQASLASGSSSPNSRDRALNDLHVDDLDQPSAEFRRIPTSSLGDDDAPEPVPRRRDYRMAQLVDMVIQRKRAENASKKNEPTCDSSIPFGKELQQYKGHRNARTMIKEACFWGEDHVMSGSDCGRVFVWEKDTGRLVMLWEADRHVVNCLQPHPTLPILATSGIDYDVKLWAPLRPEPDFDENKASEIAKRNEMLLAETLDTVTVPATFMIRMLATLNQLRQDRMRNRAQSPNEEGEEEN